MFRFIKKLFGFGSVVKVPQPIKTDAGDSSPDPLKNGSSAPDIIPGIITGASDAEKAMILTAITYVKRVVYSPEFRDAVIFAKFTSTKGLSNREIYEKFTNSYLVVNVDHFTGNWKQNHVWHTVGYEAGDGFIHSNRAFVTDAMTMGSLILHELAHTLGFSHSSASEATSVPYTCNRIFDDVTKKIGLITE